MGKAASRREFACGKVHYVTRSVTKGFDKGKVTFTKKQTSHSIYHPQAKKKNKKYTGASCILATKKGL